MLKIYSLDYFDIQLPPGIHLDSHLESALNQVK